MHKNFDLLKLKPRTTVWLAMGILAIVTAVSAVTAVIAAPTESFIKVQPIDGIWWFIDPHNKAFISMGVDTVTFNQDTIQNTKESPYAKSSLEKYHSQENWRQAIADRLMSLNFNTLGAWSDPKVAQENIKKKEHLYYTVILHAADQFDNWNHGGLPDFFDPKFPESVNQIAEKLCAPLKDDKHLIGYFGDNELLWANHDNPVLLQYLNSKTDTPGRRAAITYLEKHYSSFAEFNRIWKTDFTSFHQIDLACGKIAPAIGDRETQEKFDKDCDIFAGYVATHYFDVVEAAIKKYDPNHLNLGCRFSGYPGAQILRSCAGHVDVISFNCYETDPTKTIRRYAAVGKPLLIGEFSFRGRDSGLPNKKGAGPIVGSQRERGESFASYVKHALLSPNVVGYHWFEHVDEPKEGRFDGEDSNYGIASITDEPYIDLTHTMKEINLQSRSLHLKAVEQ